MMRCGKSLLLIITVFLGRQQWYSSVWITLYRHGQCSDIGSLTQSIMLAAQQYGVSSAIAFMFASYPDLVRAELDIPDNLAILIGIALGYEMQITYGIVTKPATPSQGCGAVVWAFRRSILFIFIEFDIKHFRDVTERRDLYFDNQTVQRSPLKHGAGTSEFVLYYGVVSMLSNAKNRYNELHYNPST